MLGANSPPSAPYKICCIEIPTQQKANSLWERMGRGHTSPWKPGELLKPGAPHRTQPQALLHRLIASAAADAWGAQGCSCLQSTASSPSRIPNRPVRHCCQILKLTGSRRRGVQARLSRSVQRLTVLRLPWSTTMDPSGALPKSSNMPSKSRPTVSGSKYLRNRQAARALDRGQGHMLDS